MTHNKPRMVLVRHNHGAADDRVTSWSLQNGLCADARFCFSGDVLGDPGEDVVGTVIYGGPYNAEDAKTHPFLLDEYRWIEACMRAEVPILGICQGAQQIAQVLGKWAGPRPDETYEFGYYQIRPSTAAIEEGFLTEPMRVAQAHFHTFDLPGDAVHLASSETYENQAFRIGKNIYGFQFHPEVTIEGFRRWQAAKWSPYGKPGAQSKEEQTRLMMLHDERQAIWFYQFLDRFFGTALTP